MSETEIIRLARQFFEESIAIEQIFKRLPQGAKIRLILDESFQAHLLHDGTATRVVPEPLKECDLEIRIRPEALRRLAQDPPASLAELSNQLIRQGLRRDLQIKFLIPSKSLLDKGYLSTLKELGPLIQGEALQGAMIYAGQALSAFENLKSRFRPKS